MTLHPHLQLQVGAPPGGASLTTVPPNYLHELTYKSAFGGLSTLDFRLTDPTYTKVEELLITSDTNSEPLFARFGYLDAAGQVSSSWIQARLMNFVPRITTRGMEISASTLIDVKDKIVEVAPKAYSGKISNVVKAIAADMDIDYEIEETDDDFNDDLPPGAGGPGPAVWLTKCRTSLQFLKEELIPRARSKSGSSNYEVYVTGSRTVSRKPVIHFHTKEYAGCSSREKPIKEFTYLAGRQDQVLEFQPNYNSSLLGKIGAAGLVMRV